MKYIFLRALSCTFLILVVALNATDEDRAGQGSC